jgi:hypothetical protein
VGRRTIIASKSEIVPFGGPGAGVSRCSGAAMRLFDEADVDITAEVPDDVIWCPLTSIIDDDDLETVAGIIQIAHRL